MKSITLNEKQQLALNTCLEGQNVLITGAGGTGKSLLLTQIRQRFAQSGQKVAVTASTGAAAVLIEGMTLHRWAGIGLGAKKAEFLAADLLTQSSRGQALRRWRTTDCLIIDEVSMIDAGLFDKIEEVARRVRGNERPFGGIQLILVGDFAQLPPVKGMGGFCFQSKRWSDVVQVQIELTEIIRQREENFMKALSEIRMGTLSKESRDLLRSRVGAEVGTDLIKPTILFSKRIDVKQYNEAELEKLPGAIREFRAYDRFEPRTSVGVPLDLREKMNRDMQARETVKLKVGAQVMLIRNMSDDLVNGSRGVISTFLPSNTLGGESIPIVRFMNGSQMMINREVWRVKIAENRWFVRKQIPLILASALTCHKCQGATLDCVQVDIADCFEYGQAYVALSRVRTLGGLSLKNGDLSRITAHPTVKKYYEQLSSNGGSE